MIFAGKDDGMISEFIMKYYIDPIRYGQPYTLVDTLTYAAILIIALYLVYLWLNRAGILVDRTFVLATVPFIVLGGLLRVVEDTGFITSDIHFLLITPLIFFVLFFFTVAALLLSRTLERAGTSPHTISGTPVLEHWVASSLPHSWYGTGLGTHRLR
ncbi:DUF63 family protein [Methanosphaerula palustris]|uniref:DUF63 family protein n=1 Tax=Methanosphaerula palustris TaxID=475088 RepID=UPI00018491BB|nr:DUF63 family protein [Methanosphaerula palustris]